MPRNPRPGKSGERVSSVVGRSFRPRCRSMLQAWALGRGKRRRGRNSVSRNGASCLAGSKKKEGVRKWNDRCTGGKTRRNRPACHRQGRESSSPLIPGSMSGGPGYHGSFSIHDRVDAQPYYVEKRSLGILAHRQAGIKEQTPSGNPSRCRMSRISRAGESFRSIPEPVPGDGREKSRRGDCDGARVR